MLFNRSKYLSLALFGLITILAAMPARAFKNIETDVIYDTAIKSQIQDEYSQALKMLKAQADGLGVAVRDKDVLALKQHMYDKAILIGECVDRAIMLTKEQDKILSDKSVKRCIETHVKFIAWLQTEHWTTSMSNCMYPRRLHGIESNDRSSINAPYDFLGRDLGQGQYHIPETMDYIGLKECFDHRSQIDRLFDK